MRMSFNVFEAIIPRITGLFGSPQDWQNATVPEREAVFNAIYLTDELSVASATLGAHIRETVNLNAIFLNPTYLLLNTNNFDIIPVLREWCRYSFMKIFEIVYQYYFVQGTAAAERVASVACQRLPAEFLL
jgi:hypothetical protein